jgi:hypothetical protein
MEIRYGGAALLGIVFAILFAHYVFSRRCPPIATFLCFGLAGVAAVAFWMGFGERVEDDPVAVVAILSAAVAGLGGALLSGIDCVREEEWRRETPGPVSSPDRSARQDLIRRVREGEGSPMGDCPHCGTRVYFHGDLGCPACGRKLDQP